jgi:large subunit ribosomal protein L1
VASGRIQATLFLSTPTLVKAISQRLGRVLGPRGLMPSERRGTVTDDIAGYIRRLQGTTEWKGDKDGTIRTPIAKVCQISSYFSPVRISVLALVALSG